MPFKPQGPCSRCLKRDLQAACSQPNVFVGNNTLMSDNGTFYLELWPLWPALSLKPLPYSICTIMYLFTIQMNELLLG